MSNKRTDDDRWREFLQELMDQIDVRDECEKWGLKFTGKVSAKGWAECHAMGREDSKPSAAVNLVNGSYVDLGGGGGSKPFFHLAAEYGPHSSFMAAVESYAREFKVKSRMPRSRKGVSFWGSLKFSRSWNDLIVKGLCQQLDLKSETLREAGGVLAATNNGEMCVCFPVYDSTELFNGNQTGFVLRNAYGGMVTVYRGSEAPEEKVPNKSVGKSGMLGKQAFQNWKSAEYVFKTEGISDFLKLSELIPEEKKETHVVITNSDGADAEQTPWNFSNNLAGKHVVICHDADLPGQYGARTDKPEGGAVRWVNAALAGGAASVVNLQLPYEVVEKKGRDIRDWINEGGTFEALMKMVEASETLTRESLDPEDDLSSLLPHQQILRALDLIVLGHQRSGSISVFNKASMRQFVIKDIDRFSYNQMLVRIGALAKEKIHCAFDGECPPDKISHQHVQRAIAEEAGGKEITRQSTIGIGLWVLNQKMVAVGAGEWLEVGSDLKSHQTPIIEDKIVDFGEAQEAWYNKSMLAGYLQQARSVEWRSGFIDEFEAVLSRWQNHKHPMAEMVLTGLCLASWMQQAWKIRPWVGLSGESSSGKTALFNYLSDYFGGLCLSASSASEAGVRNGVKCTSKIVLLDEFEASKERDKILKLMMGATRSGKVSQSLRSNTNQESISGDIQVLPWFSATELKMDKQTERNRFLEFELGNRSGLLQFVIPEGQQVEEFRNKSIAIVMKIWERALALADILNRSLEKSYSRLGESYAVPCASYAAAKGFSDVEAIELFRSLLDCLTVEVQESQESEHKMLLDAILRSPVHVGAGQKRTVAELFRMETAEGGVIPDEHLGRAGLKKIEKSEVVSISDWPGKIKERHLFIDVSKAGPVRRALLDRTEYAEMNLGRLLTRLPGAFKGREYVSGSQTRGVYVPIFPDTQRKAWPEIEIQDDFDNI